MNERIKELWVQGTQTGVPREGDYSSVSAKNIEKFAQLIVEECIAQCWSVSELEHNGYVVSECSKRVRKHFGVEE